MKIKKLRIEIKMEIIRELKIIWNSFELWKKVVLSIAMILMVLLLIFAYFSIVHPAWILWSIFIIICIYLGLKKKS